jgi:hypothetical protein
MFFTCPSRSKNERRHPHALDYVKDNANRKQLTPDSRERYKSMMIYGYRGISKTHVSSAMPLHPVK